MIICDPLFTKALGASSQKALRLRQSINGTYLALDQVEWTIWVKRFQRWLEKTSVRGF